VTARQAGMSLSELWAGRRAQSAPPPDSGPADSKAEPPPSRAGDVVDTVRNSDITLLRSLGVQYICDLMVEDRKVKYGIQLTSSEKVDKHSRYAKGFDLVTIPYPGCELFTQFRDQQYCASSVRYNWNGEEVNAALRLPTAHSNALGIDWAAEYRSWNLVRITQNYVMLLLELLRGNTKEDGGGLLIHCISGWDRTPLFISLLRISLWADGEIHQSLSATELLYLTVSYDWILFGHSLSDRLCKGEEIMLFCFDFLKFITSDKFSCRSSPSLGTGDTVQQRVASSVATQCVVQAMRAATVAAADELSGHARDFAPSKHAAAAASAAPATLNALCKRSPTTTAISPTPEVPVPSRPIDIVSKRMGTASSTNASPDSFGSWNLLSTSRLATGSIDGSFTETKIKMPSSSSSASVAQSAMPLGVNEAISAGGGDIFDNTSAPLIDTDTSFVHFPLNDGADDDESEVNIQWAEVDAPQADKSTSGYATSEDGGTGFANLGTEGNGSGTDNGSCVCTDCKAHIGADEGVYTAPPRATKLHEIRDLFLPMYRRCTPQCDDGTSWRWMVEMTKMLPGT